MLKYKILIMLIFLIYGEPIFIALATETLHDIHSLKFFAANIVSMRFTE